MYVKDGLIGMGNIHRIGTLVSSDWTSYETITFPASLNDIQFSDKFQLSNLAGKFMSSYDVQLIESLEGYNVRLNMSINVKRLELLIATREHLSRK